MDSNGTYSSGTEQPPVLVTGVFVNELDRETESVEEMFNFYRHVREVSEAQGYAVIQGIKQLNVPVMYTRLKELALSKQQDRPDGMEVDEESKNDCEVPIFSKDLIKMAKENSNFIDFRLQRILIDAVKEKQIKQYKDVRVLDSLTRMLLFESTRLLSNNSDSKSLV